MLDAVRLAAPNCPDNATEKDLQGAPVINFSRIVPGVFSNRVLKELGVLFSTPLDDDTAPLPSFSPPFQTALALRCIFLSSNYEVLNLSIVDGKRRRCQVSKRHLALR